MASEYIKQSAAAVEANKAECQRKLENTLDDLWLLVNGLGSLDSAALSDFERGENHIVDQVLTLIELAGGTDPGLRRADRITERANKVLEDAK